MLNRNFHTQLGVLLKCAVVFFCLFFSTFATVKAQLTWVPTSSPPTGGITTFAAIGTNLFAGSLAEIGSGVYRTTDNGASWTAVDSGLPYDTALTYPHYILTYIYSLASIGTDIFASDWYYGVYLSTDSGASWTSASSGLPICSSVDLAVSGSNLFVGTEARGSSIRGIGVYLSTDNGISWKSAGLNNFNVYALAEVGPNLFASTWIGFPNIGNVFVSTDNGTSWVEADSGLADSIGVVAFAAIGSNLFAGTKDSGVFLSTNNGTSWTRASAGLTNQFIVALLATGTNLFAGTNDGVFLSTDTGKSWQNISTVPLDTVGIYALTLFGSNVFAGVGNSDTSLPGVWQWVDCPASHLHLSLSSPDSGKNQQLVTFYLILSNEDAKSAGIPTDISAIHFDLTHNDDLLSFVSASGAGLTETGSAGPGPLHFTLSPVVGQKSSTDTIGTLTFRVYLTDSSTTPLSLSNISFDDTLNLPHDCIASLDSSGSEFTYNYSQCGDNLLQDALLGLPLAITPIVPNPATASITIKGSDGPFTIFDPLGRIYRVSCTAKTLDISSLPSGVYFVSDGLSRAKFVKQ